MNSTQETTRPRRNTLALERQGWLHALLLAVLVTSGCLSWSGGDRWAKINEWRATQGFDPITDDDFRQARLSAGGSYTDGYAYEDSVAVSSTATVGLDWNDRGHRVFLDGSFVGDVPRTGRSFMTMDVSPGEHVLRIENPYYSPADPDYGGGAPAWEITVAAGDIVNFN
jgi:hypothetical protein